MKASCEDACSIDRGCGCAELGAVAQEAGCTLPAGDLPERAAAFESLFARALRSMESDAQRAVWTLAWTAEIEREARALAAAEAGCCSFFEFSFERCGDELRWTATVPGEQATMLAALVGIARATPIPPAR